MSSVIVSDDTLVYMGVSSYDCVSGWLFLRTGRADPYAFPSRDAALDWLNSQSMSTGYFTVITLDEFHVLRVMAG